MANTGLGNGVQGKGLAVVTGASSGIGRELANVSASAGYDLIVAADDPNIVDMAAHFRDLGVEVQSLQVDLSTIEGVDRLLEDIAADGRSVDLLMANAGQAIGKGFLDQDFGDVKRVVDTNIVGTLYLVHQVGQ